MQLTEEQQRIVCHSKGHARVRAVAGSGKTTTMVERVYHLLEKGVEPGHILVLMFNKSARDNFERALKKRLAGTSLVSPEVRTFHALGLRLTDSFTRRGALPEFNLRTEERYKEHLGRQVAQQLSLSKEGEALDIRDKLEEFLEFIDLVKSNNSTPEQVAKETELPTKLSGFIAGYKKFEEVRHQQKIRFYADLISDPLSALAENVELQNWVADRVDFVIVDEYQDINEGQQQLLRYVAGTRAQVMVVGDGDQCIYEWRGAKPEYISRRFSSDFPNPVDYSLSYTFRYGHQLSLAANHLISKNYEKNRRLCVSHKDNFRTEISCREETKGQAHPVLQIISDWQAKGRSLSEAAVLVRLYAMSIPVEFALLEAGVAYTLQGGATVFNCSEVKALIGYLKLCNESLFNLDQAARSDYLSEMFTQPHLGLKKDQLGQFIEICAEKPQLIPFYILELASGDLPKFRQKKLRGIADNYQWLIDLKGDEDCAFVLKQLVSRFDLYNFYKDYSARQATAENRIQACEALIKFAAEKNQSIDEFLITFENLKNSDKQGGETLLITTVHRAKGLEWPLVILPGLEQGSFPFQQNMELSKTENTNYEDERRLFYVAMTRAVEHLYLLHPSDYSLQEAYRQGRAGLIMENSEPAASRFLYEANLRISSKVGSAIEGAGSFTGTLATDINVANNYLKKVGASCGYLEKSVKDEQESESPALKKRLTIAEAKPGLEIIHDRFGKGIITEIADKKQGRIKANFAHHGEMVLLLSYAKVYLV